MSDLNDVLSETPEPVSTPAPEAVSTPEPVSTPEAVSTPEPTPEPAPEPAPEPPPEPPKEPPKEEFTDKEKAFLRAAQEERRKRQELERRLAETQKEPPKQFWDDPEAALQRFREEIKQVQVNTVLNTTEALVRSQHPDFDEKVAVFAEIIQQTPGLQQQWLSSPNPAEFAYKLGKNHMELRQAGDLDAWRARVEKELRVKLEKELSDKAKAEQEKLAAIPGSLSDARSTGQNAPVWSGPTPLDDILGKG